MKMNKPSDLAMLDANILIAADQEEEEHHPVAKLLRERAKQGLIPACVSPQVLNEFYAVVTKTTGRNKPARPLSQEEAIVEVRKYYRSQNIKKIYPGPAIIERELSLLETVPVTGIKVYDLHLAATMLENGVTKIYTFNTKDFEPIPGIEVLNPLEVNFTTADETEIQDQE